MFDEPEDAVVVAAETLEMDEDAMYADELLLQTAPVEYVPAIAQRMYTVYEASFDVIDEIVTEYNVVLLFTVDVDTEKREF